MLEPASVWDRPAFPAPIRTESLGGGSALSHALGEVSGRLTPIAIDRRGGRAIFELRVDNGTASPVAAFAYPLGATGSAIDWHAGMVPSFSAIAVRLDLPYDRRRPRGAVAHVFSSECSLTLEALPPRPARPSAARRALVFAAAAGTLAAGGVGLSSMRPSIDTLVAPERVTMGRSFEVVYAATQSREVRYDVRTPDGIVVRHGTAPAGSGAFALDLPLTPLGVAYDVEVEAETALGSDRRSVRVEADPPPVDAGRAARIDAFALASDAVSGGDPIVVNYRTDARAGTIELLDQSGTERASALISHRGQSTLIAPDVDRDQDFRVVMTSRAPGGATDTAAAPIHVVATAPAPVPALALAASSGGFAGITPANATATAGGTPGAGDAPPPAGGAPGAGDAPPPAGGSPAAPIVRGPIGLDGSAIVAGHAFAIRVLRSQPGIRLAIDDADGTELSAVRPPRGAERVVMHAPPLSGTYTLVATFASALGQDSVVVPLRVTSAAAR